MAHPPGRIGKSFAASVAPTPTYARPAPTTPPPHSILNLPSRVPSFAPAVVTARPTPEFHQHHDIEPPDISAVRLRPAWLVKTRLLQLREYGLIVEAQFDAAVRWRADHDRAHGGGSLVGHYGPRVDGGPCGGRELSGLRLDALRRLRKAAAALGQTRATILLRVVVDDDTWRGLGRALGINRQTAQVRAAETLDALLAHQSGRPVPPWAPVKTYV
jgi:hypothetical protein